MGTAYDLIRTKMEGFAQESGEGGCERESCALVSDPRISGLNGGASVL